MKLVNGQIFTTTELMREFFAMDEKLIYNMTEQMRYEKLHQYMVELVRREEATSLGQLEIKEEMYYGFSYREEVYLVPSKFLMQQRAEEIEELITHSNKVLSL
ncbi:MAG: hypothetical protein ACQEQI_06805 [Bacillota bacterium]